MGFFEDVLPASVGYTPIIRRNETGGLTDTRWFQWPEQQQEMIDYVEQYADEDVYFSPMLYTKPKSLTDPRHAAKANVTACSVVWADADTAQPESFIAEPTITVETSDGKWHVYWRMIDTTDPKLCEQMAHAVTIEHRKDGADNGWGLSKRLRVPGTTNLKTDPGWDVVVRQAKGPKYTVGEFAAMYEPVEVTVVDDEMPLDLPSTTQVFNKIPYDGYVLHLFSTPPLGDMSTALYTLEMKLFEYGLNPVDVFAVAKDAACNKFNRPGRTEYELWQHVLKAHGNHLDNEAVRKRADEPDAEPEDEYEFEHEDNGVASTWDALDLLDKEERANLPRTFIDDYADWGKAQSSRSARQYHEASAFTILSTVFSEFAHIVPGWGPTPLNLYFLVLGKTTRSRKSTAKNMMMRLLDDLSPEDSIYDYDLGSDATPEALTATLSERPGRSSIFWRDEVQGLFSAVASGGYLRGLLPMLTDAYDGAVQGVLRKTGDKKRTRKTKTNLIFYGMGIVDQVAATLTDDDFFSGFLPRVLWVVDLSESKEYGSTDVVQRTDESAKQVDKTYEHLFFRISEARKFWQDYKNRTGESYAIRATDEAWTRWQRMTVDIEELAATHETRGDVLSPGAQRLGVATLKAAALLAMFDQSAEIELRHMQVAIRYATEWAKYMEYMSRQVSKSALLRDAEILLEFVNSHTKPVPYGRALAHFKGSKSVREFNDLVEYLVQTGEMSLNVKGARKTLEAK